MGKEILNIYCPSCASPTKFDIVHQRYLCSHCGGEVMIEDARKEKIEFLETQREKLEKSANNFSLFTTSCSGCGAQLVFEENEALADCEFCGRSLARTDYVLDDKMSQYVIPFAITKDEATELLKKWCKQNKRKDEAKRLLENLSKLKGYYLPYEMVRGPVRCTVKQIDSNPFEAEGFLKDEFVNCSSQMDNLVLDCMEPYNLDSLKEFDFSYVAGQRVKISDIDDNELLKRLNREVAQNYRSTMEKIWGTKSINIYAQADPVVKIPVLLPAYYIVDGKFRVAVNGQTGKISISALKDLNFLSIPWWVSGIAVFILACVITYYAMLISVGNGDAQMALALTGALAFIYLLLFGCMYDQEDNSFTVTSYRNILSSGEKTYWREGPQLVLREEILKRKIEKPVFRENLDGKEMIVTYKFFSIGRILKQLAIALGTIFLPVILALFVNGFNFEQLNIAASSIWFLCTLIIVPVFFIQAVIMDFYNDPLIYTISENGKKQRYRKKIILKDVFKAIKIHLIDQFPVSLITWFVLFLLFMMVYFTAFGVE